MSVAGIERHCTYWQWLIIYPENDLPLCTNYNDIRAQKLEKPCFSAGVIVSYAATGDERIKEKALANAIPEFLRFNIVEGEVRNVC